MRRTGKISVPIERHFAGNYRLEYDGKYITLFGKDSNYPLPYYGPPVDNIPVEYDEMVLVPVVAEIRNARPEIVSVSDNEIIIYTNKYTNVMGEEIQNIPEKNNTLDRNPWQEAMSKVWGSTPPREAHWDHPAAIANVLAAFNNTDAAAANIFLPNDGGCFNVHGGGIGEDPTNVEVLADKQWPLIFKPTRLAYWQPGLNSEWGFFLLETADQRRLFDTDDDEKFESYLQTPDGHYHEDTDYNRQELEQYSCGMRVVKGGNYLIINNASPYNEFDGDRDSGDNTLEEVQAKVVAFFKHFVRRNRSENLPIANVAYTVYTGPLAPAANEELQDDVSRLKAKGMKQEGE